MLDGKNVVLGVTGSISAYKACELCSLLVKSGANVDVIMTKNATEFVVPLTFETLTNNKVNIDMFDRVFTRNVTHVSLAKKADIFVVCPATANVIAKFATGIADDMLSSTYIACKAPKLICPAMNVNMYENVANVENMKILSERGVMFVEPIEGRLACGDVAKGKLADVSFIFETIVNILNKKKDYLTKRVLITAGATEENIDGVRVITNHSSGKMGVAIAEKAIERGAEVTLIFGNVKVELPKNLKKAISVKSTIDMLNAVESEVANADVIIMAAAPSDYRPKETYKNKIKAQELTLNFEKNPDIAATIGKIKGDKKLVIFSAETQDLIENATKKLIAKNADLVVANDVTREGAGFYVDTNIATLIDKNGKKTECPLMKKSELADIILDKVLE